MTVVQIIRNEGPEGQRGGPGPHRHAIVSPPLAPRLRSQPPATAGRLAIVNRPERRLLSRRRDRQPEEYPRSPAGRRLEVDHAPVVPHDPVAHRKAQPSPHPDRLGGEERLEDLLPELRVDPGTIVGDLDLDGIIDFPRPHDNPPACQGMHRSRS